MTTRKFLTTIALMIIVASAFIGLVPIAFAANPWDPGESNPDPDHITVITSNFIEVTPTYNYPTDPPTEPTDPKNVRWAVNNVDSGGTVLLKAGVFDFGNNPENEHYNFVGIYNHNKDPNYHITIMGESTSSTIIKNGLAPFRVYSTPMVDGDPSSEAFPIQVTIKDIWFDEPYLTAISIFTGSATITGNKITNVQAARAGPPFAPWVALGISASGYEYMASYDSSYPSLVNNMAPGYPNFPNDPSKSSMYCISEFGDITVQDNVLDGAYGDIVKGLFISDIKEDIKVSITNNVVSNLVSSPIYGAPYLIDVRGFEHPDSVRRIEYNTVSSPLSYITEGSWYSLFGIDVSAHFLGSSGKAYINYNTIISEGIPDPPVPDPYIPWWCRAIFFRGRPSELSGEIIGNTIIGDWGTGILLLIVSDCIVEKNEIDLSGSAFSGITLSETSYTTVRKNKISGSTIDYPLYIESGNGNEIYGNNMKHIEYIQEANLLFGSQAINNIAVGNFGDNVIDLQGVHIPETVIFYIPNQLQGPILKWGGIFYWFDMSADVQYVAYNFGTAGYESDDMTKPLTFQRTEYPIITFRFLFEDKYWVHESWIVNAKLIQTETEIILPWGASVPDPAGVPIIFPKNNHITGFEPMRDAGGIGR